MDYETRNELRKLAVNLLRAAGRIATRHEITGDSAVSAAIDEELDRVGGSEARRGFGDGSEAQDTVVLAGHVARSYARSAADKLGAEAAEELALAAKHVEQDRALAK